MFFHDAADSEELWEEALRCEIESVSSHMYQPDALPSIALVCDVSGLFLIVIVLPLRFEHTVAVLVALLFAAPKARAPRIVVRANIVGELSKPQLMCSTPGGVVEGSGGCCGGSPGRLRVLQKGA